MAKTKMKKGHITLQDGRTMRVQKMSTPQYMVQHKWLYFLLLPGALYFILFRYVPMGGLVIAFKEYSPFLGMWESPWCGFDQFTKFFTGNDFSKLLVNTLGISLLQLVLYFPAPIILSLFLNEVRHSGYKRVVQTLVYIPHFVSWVIVASLTYQLFNVSDGIVNIIIKGITGSSWDVLSKSSTFWGLIVGQDIWRETGYGTIVFLAALAGVDQELYEAARVDGASRLKQIWHVTLPGIMSTIVIMFILQVGGMMNAGFDQVFNLRNSSVTDISQILDTYVYDITFLSTPNYGFSTAVGLFKSVINFALLFVANTVTKKISGQGMFA